MFLSLVVPQLPDRACAVGNARPATCAVTLCYKDKGSKAGSTAKEQADEANTQTPTHAAPMVCGNLVYVSALHRANTSTCMLKHQPTLCVCRLRVTDVRSAADNALTSSPQPKPRQLRPSSLQASITPAQQDHLRPPKCRRFDTTGRRSPTSSSTNKPQPNFATRNPMPQLPNHTPVQAWAAPHVQPHHGASRVATLNMQSHSRCIAS